jgi:diacylglycerol kinase (ATP)
MARPLVLLNPKCNYGTGRKRWDKVGAGLRERLGDFDLVEFGAADSMKDLVARGLDNGSRFLVAAGGDGTVNVILNALFELGRAGNVTLGAVGLGSSNDFHKPFRAEDYVGNCPVRVSLDRAQPVDAIRIELPSGVHYCLLNASIGLTAEANDYFNSRTGFIRVLQRLSVNTAVNAAALRTMLRFSNIPLRIKVDDSATVELEVNNMGVIKRPYFAGSLRYDTPIAPDDGRLGVNVAHGLSFFGRIGAFAAVSRGSFNGRPGTRTAYGRRVEVSGPHDFAVEFDGEVTRTDRISFSVVPKAIEVCL